MTLFQQKKPMLTLPDDREKLRSLDETLRNIISYESDRDVRKVSRSQSLRFNDTAIFLKNLYREVNTFVLI